MVGIPGWPSESLPTMERYTLGKRIGAGSFGQAFLATDLTGTRVVMKRVPLGGLSAEDVVGAKREGALLSSISHPCVNRLLDSFVDAASNDLCLVSEYCARGDLGRALEGAGAGGRGGGALPLAAVLDLAVQLGLALLWLHRKKMLHRDIKPANIFIKGDGSYALGDFGIARQLKNTGELAKTVVGTPYYLAPELCEGRPYSFKADVWSYGVVLYEAAVGRKPFEGSSMQSLFKRILRGRVDYPAALAPPLAALLASALHTNAAARPPLLDILRCDLLRPALAAYVGRCAAVGVEVPGLDALRAREGAAAAAGSSSAGEAGGGSALGGSPSPAPLPAPQPRLAQPIAFQPPPTPPTPPTPTPPTPTPKPLPPSGVHLQQFKTPARVLGAALPTWRVDPTTALPEAAPTTPLYKSFAKNPAPPMGSARALVPGAGGGSARALAVLPPGPLPLPGGAPLTPQPPTAERKREGAYVLFKFPLRISPF